MPVKTKSKTIAEQLKHLKRIVKARAENEGKLIAENKQLRKKIEILLADQERINSMARSRRTRYRRRQKTHPTHALRESGAKFPPIECDLHKSSLDLGPQAEPSE